MTLTLPLFETDAGRADRPVCTTPAVDTLLAAGAPVAIGVSGGKDSCAVAIAFVAHLRRIGHAGPVVLIHSDLGRVEWSDSAPTCRRLADHLGAELVTVRRAAGGMMERWHIRWANNVARYASLECAKLILPWSTPSMRFCTSELKTAVIARELIRRFPGRAIVSVSGVRGEESANRAKAPIAKPQPRLDSRKWATSGIDVNAIHDWKIGDVWACLEAAGFAPHEAYTRYGSSRVSCRFCIMGSESDIRASAGVAEHAELYREMVGLEVVSTFAFQGGKWLGDVRPDLIDAAALEGAKFRGRAREAAEGRIPAHLLYEKGWPTVMPTAAEAELLAAVRRDVAAVVGLTIDYTTGPAVLDRYAQLMAAKAAKE